MPASSAPQESYFHLHLVSDATGETLITVGRAASARYAPFSPVEHVYPLVRTQKQIDRVISAIEGAPGIVLYTMVDPDLSERLEASCREFGIPCMSVLAPVLSLFQSYLGAETAPRVGAQHTLDAHYFKRIDAMNFTMMHDDGQLVNDLDDADVILVGISRTSKTPTAIYLANRGIKTANVPLVPSVPPPPQLDVVTRPLIVALVASPERISQIRQNRVLGLNAAHTTGTYVDRQAIAEELAFTKRLAARNNWAMIDVTRRSIEETAAAIMSLINERRRQVFGHE